MIPVYVISMPTSHERREIMRRQLDALQIPFRFHDAIDGRRLDRDELLRAAPGGGIYYSGMLTPEEIGCALSHLCVIQKIAQSEDEYAAVLEDDVVVMPESRKFLAKEYLTSLRPFDVLQLDGAHPDKVRLTLQVAKFDRSELCALTTCHHSMYGLIYTREAARKIITSIPQITSPIDNMIFKDFCILGLRIVALRPSVVTHMGLPSEIGRRQAVEGLFNKFHRELRRFRSWRRRWRSFAQAWGFRGILGLRLRRP